MKWASLLFVASFSCLPQIAEAQTTDCNALARDLVVKNFQSSWSDYSKLLFLSSLTTMDIKTSSEALAHSGQVSVGPIAIGPGTWSKEKQDQLRSDLQKIVNVEQLKQSAASVSISSGDPDTAKVVENCFSTNGGLFIGLTDLGKETAVMELRWTSYPGTRISAIIDSVTPIHGRIIGGGSYTRQGAKLGDRLSQRVTIKRDDPKQDLAIVVNTTNAGSGQGYLPPSELPPPQPVTRVAIDGEPIEVGSGERFDGYRNPGCQEHAAKSCVRPQHGGKIVKGSGRPKVVLQVGRSGTRDSVETEEEYCITFWANTGACETPVFIRGTASATEEYLLPPND
jgi:hypothetical protein